MSLGMEVSVDGGEWSEVGNISIEASIAGEHTVTYRSTDQAGNAGTAERQVIVEEVTP
jgi:hypothetical protein